MLEEFARKQLHFIIQKYGQSIIEDTRRCRGVLKDLAPKHQRETNLILLVQEHKLINELLQESQIPVSIKLDRLSQKLHDNVGIQKDFALWAIESWAIALNILPSEYQNLVPDKHDKDFYKNDIPARLFELGERFYNGYGVDKDNIEAIKYYLLAAEQGHVEAQYNLAWIYDENELDTEESIKWYRMAAEQGHAKAQYNLGWIYEAKENIEEAIKWYLLAAEQNDVDALSNLGSINFYSIEKNEEEAFKWWRLASEQGDVDSFEEIMDLANEGYAEAQFSLGEIHFWGQYVEKSYTEAFKWYQLAANQGHVESQYSLGELYYYGDGFPEDETEAFKWYQLAANQGHVESQYSLGRMYYYLSNGVKKNEELALKWYKLAVEQGHEDAKSELCLIYYEYGSQHQYKGGSQNINEAIKYYRLSGEQKHLLSQQNLFMLAEQGYVEAQFNLGEMYFYGKGFEKNEAEAIKWYKLASKQR
jgi:TPR repeat protein